MREIKFRAWDEDSKSFVRSDDIGMLAFCQWADSFADIEFQQYTGLKDKNGVEIYEGDIVKDNIFGLYTVFFSYGGFKLIGVNELSNQLALMDSHSNWYEVIGNIYEHPDLLEATK